MELEKELDGLLDFDGQWFVINCNTGHEEKVLTDLKQKVKSINLENEIFDIRISRGRTTTKSGKETIKNRFPGYIFINMIMSEKAWFQVRNTPGVTGFIGSSGRGAKPFPLTDDEIERMLVYKDEEIIPVEVEDEIEEKFEATDENKIKGIAVPKKELKTAPFKEGEFVLVLSGPHENEEVEVIEMNYSKGVAIVKIELFGRYTPTEIEFENLKPMKEY